MRKLMWFALGFAAACAVCVWLWAEPNLHYMAGIFILLFLTGLMLKKRFPWCKRVAAAALGVAIGLLWFRAYHVFYLDTAMGMDGETCEIIAQCTDYGYQTDYGTAVDVWTALDGKVYRAKLYLNGEPELSPGDYVRGQFRLRITTPGGAEDATYHQGKGIFLLCYQKSDAQMVPAEKIPWYLYPAKLRRQLITQIDASFPEDTAGFARALLLGDRTGVDYKTNTALKTSGISHVIAVSGLHVSILFGFVYALCLKRRWPTAVIGSSVLLLFAAVVGFSPSVTRACMMLILMMLAMLVDKEYDGPSELAFSALVMLLANPLVITSVSFQLSVGSIAGIFMFREKLSGWMEENLGCGKKNRFVKGKRWLSSSVSVTLSAMSLTTPLVAYHYGTVSLIGILTNLLTLWVISFIFYGIMLVCAIGTFLPNVCAILSRAISVPIRYVLAVVKVLGRSSLAAVYTKSRYIIIWLVLVYILLAVFLLRKKRRPVLLICCGGIGLCLALALSWIEPMTDACRVSVLDVGQGQCIILQSEGKTYLVDCGGSYDEEAADTATETLISQGVFRLDGVILTHYDRDHSGGLPALLSRMETDCLFMPDAQDDDGIGQMLSDLTNGTVVMVSDNLLLEYGQTSITIFGPALTSSDNDSSLAVLFQAAECDILITGDRSDFGERMLLRQMELPELEILVVGHHGSKYSTCAELLEATHPYIAAISVGENSYGHPAEETLERLEEYGCLIWRTDLNGNIIFRR